MCVGDLEKGRDVQLGSSQTSKSMEFFLALGDIREPQESPRTLTMFWRARARPMSLSDKPLNALLFKAANLGSRNHRKEKLPE